MSEPAPPKRARRLLELAIHPEDRRFALADLEEEFERRTKRRGVEAARKWYRTQAARSLAPLLVSRFVRLRRGLAAELVTNLGAAVRSLAASPMIALATILSLAVGIAAATSVFTATNAFLLRPASASILEPERLVSIYTAKQDGSSYRQTSFPDFEDIRLQVNAFSDLAAVRMAVLRVSEGSRRRSIAAEIVTGNYFDLLGITPKVGRFFQAEESQIGSAERLVVISHRMWQTRFGGSDDVVGATLDLDGIPFTVVGIAPADLTGRIPALKIDAWVPLGIPGGMYHSDERELADRSDREHMVIGRLRQGMSVEQAGAQLELLSTRLHARYPQDWEDEGARPLSLTLLAGRNSHIPPDFLKAAAGFSGLVMAAAALILLVACFNVASLFLARAGRRAPEMAIWLALGASRRRLVMMLLTESVTLALFACALGVFLSARAMGLMDSVSLPIGDLSMEFDFSIDYRVLGFALLVSIATSVVFGLAPALEASKPSLLPSLKGDTLQARRRHRPLGLRNLLVVGQVATALIFVVGAGVTLSSFDALIDADWGVQPDRIALLSKNLRKDIPPDAFVSHYRDLLARFRAHPEVEDAQLARVVEGGIFAAANTVEIRVAGYERASDESLTVPFNAVAPGYMEMVAIRLIRGRTIGELDDAGSVHAAVVTEAFVRRFWGERDGLGEQFSVVATHEMGDPQRSPVTTHEIVGVAVDARYQGFEGADDLYIWSALYQQPSRRTMLLLQGRSSAESMVRLLAEEIDPNDGEFALVSPRTYAELISFQFGFLNATAKVLGWAGAFGLALAAIGIYGMVSFAVTRRNKELAVRQAVGALPGQVMQAVLREGLQLSVWGLAVGLVVIVPLTALLRADLAGISPVDPASTAFGAAVLMAVALIASLIPARRVTRLDPVATLRED